MNYAIIKKLTPVDEIIESAPLSDAGYQRIQKDRQELRDIIEGKDDRLVIIVGPCSAWPKPAVLEYADRLAIVSERVKERLKLVMRVYIQKPRTTKGWTGPVNQPDPLAYPDIEAGVRYVRDMMVKVVEKGLPIADEALFTHNAKGFLELLSWVAIGARSSENQEHRIFASAMDCVVGMKNPTHGSLAVAVNSVLAAQSSHVAVFDNHEVKTAGNAHAHLVLRGSNLRPNYSMKDLQEVNQRMAAQAIKNPAVVIDASHDNCIVNGKKDYHLQPQVIHAVLKNRDQYPEIKRLIKGFMIESFLKDGYQKISAEHASQIDWGGLSITDPCLGWDKTEKFLLDLADRV